MHLLRSLLVAVILLVSAKGFSQKLKYSIRLNDEVVGNMTAERTTKAKSTITINSFIAVQKFIKIELQYFMESVYEKGKLLTSRTIQKFNGQEQANSSTTFDKDGYKVSTKQGNSRVNLNAIQHNLCKLYFEEPAGIKEVWSDTYGRMLQIRPAGKNKYELILPDGKSNFYSYYKGICTLVETETPVGKVTFQLG